MSVYFSLAISIILTDKHEYSIKKHPIHTIVTIVGLFPQSSSVIKHFLSKIPNFFY